MGFQGASLTAGRGSTYLRIAHESGNEALNTTLESVQVVQADTNRWTSVFLNVVDVLPAEEITIRQKSKYKLIRQGERQASESAKVPRQKELTRRYLHKFVFTVLESVGVNEWV